MKRQNQSAAELKTQKTLKEMNKNHSMEEEEEEENEKNNMQAVAKDDSHDLHIPTFAEISSHPPAKDADIYDPHHNIQRTQESGKERKSTPIPLPESSKDTLSEVSTPRHVQKDEDSNKEDIDRNKKNEFGHNLSFAEIASHTPSSDADLYDPNHNIHRTTTSSMEREKPEFIKKSEDSFEQEKAFPISKESIFRPMDAIQKQIATTKDSFTETMKSTKNVISDKVESAKQSVTEAMEVTKKNLFENVESTKNYFTEKLDMTGFQNEDIHDGKKKMKPMTSSRISISTSVPTSTSGEPMAWLSEDISFPGRLISSILIPPIHIYRSSTHKWRLVSLAILTLILPTLILLFMGWWVVLCSIIGIQFWVEGGIGRVYGEVKYQILNTLKSEKKKE